MTSTYLAVYHSLPPIRYESKSNKLLPRNASSPLLRLTQLQSARVGVAEGGNNSPFSCQIWIIGVPHHSNGVVLVSCTFCQASHLPWSTYFHWQIPSSSECGAHPVAASRANGSQCSNDAFGVPFAHSQLRKASCLSRFWVQAWRSPLRIHSK